MTLAVPASRRGAFMSLSGSARDLAAGLAASVAGWVVAKGPSGELVNYDWLGWLAVAAALVSLWLARHVRVNEAPVPEPMQALSTRGWPEISQT